MADAALGTGLEPGRVLFDSAESVFAKGEYARAGQMYAEFLLDRAAARNTAFDAGQAVAIHRVAEVHVLFGNTGAALEVLDRLQGRLSAAGNAYLADMARI